MATVKPFKALRPKPELAEKIASVPYDVVNTEQARQLAEGNELSFLHIIRPEIDLDPGVGLYQDEVYEQASLNFKRFKERGYLIEENHPAFYVYRLKTAGQEQIGIAGCCAVDEYDDDTIKKHEFTRKAKEDDRVRHMLSLRAHAGPVLLTYRRTERLSSLILNAIQADPLYDFVDVDDVQHTIWTCDEVEAIEETFKEVPALYIADGHHRAAGASRVKGEMLKQNGNSDNSEEFNYYLNVIFPSDQLKIFPYNKYVTDLNGKTVEDFIEEVKKEFSIQITEQMQPQSKSTFCMYLDGQWYSLQEKTPSEPKDPVDALDLAKFQNKLLEPILGIVDQRKDNRIDFAGGAGSPATLKQWVDAKGGAAFTFFPVSVGELMEVSDAGMVMPPKSTWFAPKLRSGLLIHQF
jgi:uncharacterized protein (DUF1015 family)